jgi:hypothetical protein
LAIGSSETKMRGAREDEAEARGAHHCAAVRQAADDSESTYPVSHPSKLIFHLWRYRRNAGFGEEAKAHGLLALCLSPRDIWTIGPAAARARDGKLLRARIR